VQQDDKQHQNDDFEKQEKSITEQLDILQKEIMSSMKK